MRTTLSKSTFTSTSKSFIGGVFGIGFLIGFFFLGTIFFCLGDEGLYCWGGFFSGFCLASNEKGLIAVSPLD